MKTTKTEQHLYTTIKKILKNHFYNFPNVECTPDYSQGKVLYLIRFFTRLGIHGKRDLTLFDVLIKDTKDIEFDIIGITVNHVEKSNSVVSCSGDGLPGSNGISATYHYDYEKNTDINHVLSEYYWLINGFNGKDQSQTFIDLRAFFKSYYVVKNVVKVNDTINERVMMELLNHHV